MFGRPRNRRRPTERALKAPATNWRAVGLTLGTVAGVAGSLAVLVVGIWIMSRRPT